MDDIARDIIGGEVYFVIGDKKYESMADVKIRPRRRELTAGATSAGRMYGTEKARLVEAEITFPNHGDAPPMSVFDLRRASVTIVEKSRNVRHLLTDALVVGTPDQNLQTGEVTGISFATDKYSVT